MPGTEDYITFTEAGAGGDFTINASRIDLSNVPRSSTKHIYKDGGVDAYAGDFEHFVEVRGTFEDTNGFFRAWGLSNTIAALKASSFDHFNLFCHSVSAGEFRIQVRQEYVGGAVGTTTFSGSNNTPYYLTIRKDSAVGLYGTLYLDIYTDFDRTVSVASESVLLADKPQNFRYLYAFSGEDIASASEIGGYVKDLSLEIPPDGTAPTVSSVTPVDGTHGVAIATTITATFDEDIDPTTLTTSTFIVEGVAGSIAYDDINFIATFTPDDPLDYSTVYNVTLTTGIKDIVGNALAADYEWSFTATLKIRLSFNPQRNELFILNYITSKSYVYGEHGLSSVSGEIEDIVYDKGVLLIHSPAVIVQDDIIIKSNIIDFDELGSKRILGVSADVITPNDVFISIQFRTDRNDAFTTTPEIALDKARGYAKFDIKGVESIVNIRIEDYTSLKLNDVKVDFSYLDRRRRGG